MSEVLGRLNAAIQAQGPDQLWVDARDALAAAYQTISDLRVDVDASLESARNYRSVAVEAQKVATDMGLLARDLDRESGTISPHVIASDIRDVLDGHPERVAWTTGSVQA